MPGPDELDLDRDGAVSDAELAQATPPDRWHRRGLYGPAIILRWIGRNAKRTAVFLLGVSVLAAGVLFLFLPGPGFIFILVGLAILATEFVWAERALDLARDRGTQAVAAVQDNPAGRWLLVLSGVGLIAAGVVAGIVLDRLTIAVSLVVAGVIALATLTPPAQRWLGRQRAVSDAKRDASG